MKSEEMTKTIFKKFCPWASKNEAKATWGNAVKEGDLQPNFPADFYGKEKHTPFCNNIVAFKQEDKDTERKSNTIFTVVKNAGYGNYNHKGVSYRGYSGYYGYKVKYTCGPRKKVMICELLPKHLGRSGDCQVRRKCGGMVKFEWGKDEYGRDYHVQLPNHIGAESTKHDFVRKATCSSQDQRKEPGCSAPIWTTWENLDASFRKHVTPEIQRLCQRWCSWY